MAALSEQTIRSLPKVLLHDHLDGGLRPDTVAALAAETGYAELPETDPEKLATVAVPIGFLALTSISVTVPDTALPDVRLMVAPEPLALWMVTPVPPLTVTDLALLVSAGVMVLLPTYANLSDDVPSAAGIHGIVALPPDSCAVATAVP